MMSPYTLIDTDILIDAGSGVVEAVDVLSSTQNQSGLAISVITHMELIVGCRNKLELHKPDVFLKQFMILDINESISKKAIDLIRRYRLSHGLLIADSLIAATAMIVDCEFITKNLRDYRFIQGLNLRPYPQPGLTK